MRGSIFKFRLEPRKSQGWECIQDKYNQINTKKDKSHPLAQASNVKVAGTK